MNNYLSDNPIEIIDLDDHRRNLYFHCLEDWSDEMKESGDRKSCWYQHMKDRGLRVKLALDSEGNAGGMIHYAPIEHTHVEGQGLYFIHCIWVHGHKQGRGNFQKHGFGTSLLSAAEQDARALGALGMAAWGISLPFWMKASWFKKHGYRKADKNEMAVLLWKPFSENASPPKWISQKKTPLTAPGLVTVTSFTNGWCPAQNITHERAKRAAAEIGGRVRFESIDTLDRNTFLEWGISDGLFIEGKALRTGPPPSYDKIKKLILKNLKRMKADPPA